MYVKFKRQYWKLEYNKIFTLYIPCLKNSRAKASKSNRD